MDDVRKSPLAGFFTVVGIAVSVLFVLLVIGGIAVNWILRPQSRPTTPAVVKPASQDKDLNEQSYYALGNSQRLGDYMMFRLTAGKRSKFASYSYYPYGRTVNYLFIDVRSGDAHWLWQKQMPLVLHEYSTARLNEKEKVPKDTRGLLVTLVDKDTNQDKFFDETDGQALIVIKPDGKTLRLIEDITKLTDITAIDDQRMLMVYEKGGKSYTAMYAPDTYSVTMEKELPQILVP